MLNTVSALEWFFKNSSATSHFHNSSELSYVQLRQSLHNLYDEMKSLSLFEEMPYLEFPRQLQSASFEFFIDRLFAICQFVELSHLQHPIRKVTPTLNAALVYLVFCAKSSKNTELRQTIIDSIKKLN